MEAEINQEFDSLFPESPLWNEQLTTSEKLEMIMVYAKFGLQTMRSSSQVSTDALRIALVVYRRIRETKSSD